jgi:hypothetical protein
MVILKAISGFEIQILVGGQALPEYENDEEPEVGETVTKYIEAQSGTEFAIQYRFGYEFYWKHDIHARPLIDSELGHVLGFERRIWKEHIDTGPASRVCTEHLNQRYLFRELALSKCTSFKKHLAAEA